ncbi:MAG: ribonuclease P protein component [Candidatus Omnitrophota bacterium]
MASNSFSQKERLRKNSSIRGVFNKGVLYRAGLIDLYLLKRDDDPVVNRCAFICRKGLHQKKSVLRNRIRRVLREAYRKKKHLFPTGYDIVIIAKGVKEYTKSGLVEKEIADVFKKHVKK